MPTLPVVVPFVVVDRAEEGLQLELLSPLHVFLEGRRDRGLLRPVTARLLRLPDEGVVES